MSLSGFELAALVAGELFAVRRPVNAARSLVRPGQFENLKLETGRAVRMSNICELRAQCLFNSGKTRTVTVSPRFARKDLIWIRPESSRREDSKWTLEIRKIDVSRLQDVSDSEAAYDLGASFIPLKAGQALEGPRARYARVWNSAHAEHERAFHWDRNPWVWILHVQALAWNVDKLLAGREP